MDIALIQMSSRYFIEYVPKSSLAIGIVATVTREALIKRPQQEI
jgi:hypothetical protein